MSIPAITRGPARLGGAADTVDLRASAHVAR